MCIKEGKGVDGKIVQWEEEEMECLFINATALEAGQEE